MWDTLLGGCLGIYPGGEWTGALQGELASWGNCKEAEEEEEVCSCLVVAPLSPLEKSQLFDPKGRERTAKGQSADLAFTKCSAMRPTILLGRAQRTWRGAGRRQRYHFLNNSSRNFCYFAKQRADFSRLRHFDVPRLLSQ